MTEPRRRALGWIGTRLSDHRAELVEVRGEVDSMRRAMDERIATAGKALTRLAEIEMHELRDPLMRHSRGGDDGDAKSAGLTRLERLHKAFAAFVARGVDFAVMPCCQRDLATSGQMAHVAKSLGIAEHAAIDVARLGGIVARGYDCRWRTIDVKITPQNRLLVGLARRPPEMEARRRRIEAESNAKIKQIYSRVHATPPPRAPVEQAPGAPA